MSEYLIYTGSTGCFKRMIQAKESAFSIYNNIYEFFYWEPNFEYMEKVELSLIINQELI